MAVKRRSKRINLGRGAAYEETDVKGRSDHTAWNDTRTRQLEEAWATGLPAAEIGRRIGMSKNAVIGKARRLRLQCRPSPIRSGTADGPMTAISGAPSVNDPGSRRNGKGGDSPNDDALDAEEKKPTETTNPRSWEGRTTDDDGHTLSCCWPIGNPGSLGFQFCNQAAALGRPYCAKHCGLAYVTLEIRTKA